jgi:hypothetical protein
MKNSQLDRLEQRLANMAREVPPSRDLWPDIASKIARRPGRYRPYVLMSAIAAAAACFAGLSTWAVMHHLTVPANLPALAQSGGSAAEPFVEPSDAHYIAARDSLQQTFEERLTQLDPATRAQIEASLAVIRKANTDIRQALAGQPNSPLLQQLWESTWHDEFDLYNRVVQSTQPSVTRS